jgi:hypothetical protein
MLVRTLETFGREKAFTLILNRGVVDYSSPSVDISPDLIAKFNEMHKVQAAAGATKKPGEAPKESPKH